MDENILPKLLDQLSKIHIVKPWKKGGQKTVYKARHTDFGDIVLKLVYPSNAEEKERVLREVDIAASLESRLFSKLYDFGEFVYKDQCVLYIVEELLPGKNLREIINSYYPKPIPINETHLIMNALMEALTITEQRNLVHRDIKPENIIVCTDRVVLIDFGIARNLDLTSITNSFAIFGPLTPGYSPPEQIHNEKRKISIRTDMFSLAVVFYELLTGNNPYIIGTKSAGECIQNTLTIQPRALASYGHHSSFDNFIFQCLQKSCHRRPINMIQAMELYNLIEWEA